MPAIVGVDVGGTFTDVVVFDEAAGRVRTAKVPSTLDDQSNGLVAGIAAAGLDFAEIASLVHGTTVATNTVLERDGAKVGLITTRGFRDVLEMRRRDRPQLYGLWGVVDPLAERYLRREVGERTDAEGVVLEPLDEEEVRRVVRELLADGVEALAITFLHSYANPANERRAAEIAREEWPNEYVAVSSEILPEIREFERTSTTVLTSYVQPRIDRYLRRIEDRLAERRSTGSVLIFQSNGGVMSIDATRTRPANTVLSGPAAGVVAAGHIALAAGYENAISCDMGGTSTDIAVIANGQAAMTEQATLDFGVVVRAPMVEIVAIGSGGGSIAEIDASGLLQVGPRSAGAAPGPACYGQGGTEPTMTDANLVLGRINAGFPIGDRDRLDVERARAAIERHVGAPLGLDVEDAAEAMVKVANSKMAGAIRVVSVERGHDPRRFALVVFGGAGPLHAGALLRDVGFARAIVPYLPGLTSALGCITSDVKHDFVQTINTTLETVDVGDLEAIVADHVERGGAMVRDGELGVTATEVTITCDMAYAGQTHSLAVAVARDALTADGLRAAFAAAYEDAYGGLLDGLSIRLLNLRTSIVGLRPALDLRAVLPGDGTGGEDPVKGVRRVYFDGAFADATVYDRARLAVGTRLASPAVVEQGDTTVVIDPGLSAWVDDHGNLILEPAS